MCRWTRARVVRCAGAVIDLTTVEFDLLGALLRAAGRVIPRDEMVRTVLRREFSPFDRSIDTHVSNLRRKLGPASDGSERDQRHPRHRLSVRAATTPLLEP